MSDNAVAIAVVLPTVVMGGLLLIVVVRKILDVAGERVQTQFGSQHPMVTDLRRLLGADLAEIRRRLDDLEEPAGDGSRPPRGRST